MEKIRASTPKTLPFLDIKAKFTTYRNCNTDPMRGTRHTNFFARGGCGIFYEEAPRGPASSGKKFLLKRIRPELLGDRIIHQRFLFERSTAQVLGERFPWAFPEVSYSDLSEDEMLIERVGCMNLRGHICNIRKLDLDRVLDLGIQICEALELMRCTNGIVHRDLKHDNIVVDTQDRRRDIFKVIDFGHACDLDNPLPQRFGHIGSPCFRAPEGYNGKEKHDCRFDLYSLGVMLTEAYHGKKLFKDDLPLESKEKIGEFEMVSQLPEGIREIVTKLLAYNKADRYATPNEVGRDIAALAYKRRGDSIVNTHPYGIFLDRTVHRLTGPLRRKVSDIVIS